jgi:hypothetical protein
LLSVSKDGGAVTTLIETPSQVLTPLGVDRAGRMFVRSSDGYVKEVTSSGALEGITNIPAINAGGIQMVEDLAYWPGSDPGADRTPLLAAAPGGGEPMRVTPLDASPLLPPVFVGRGVVLWAPEEYRSEQRLFVQHFEMLNENTGCVQPLPSVELSIGQTLLDGRHVYWQSFDGLGSASPRQPDAAAPLLRVDLRTGRFEHVAVPGFEITVVTDLVAQDADTIYVRSNGELFAVRKPD